MALYALIALSMPKDLVGMILFVPLNLDFVQRLHLLLWTNVTMLSFYCHYCFYLALLIKQVMINIVTKNEIKYIYRNTCSVELKFYMYSKSFVIRQSSKRFICSKSLYIYI